VRGALLVSCAFLQAPTLDSDGRGLQRAINCWITKGTIIGCYFGLRNCLMDGLTKGIYPYVGGGAAASAINTVFDGCATIEPVTSIPTVNQVGAQIPVWYMKNCAICNTPGADGILFHGGIMRLVNVDISNCGRDGIRCAQGSGIAYLQSVGTTGTANAGYGINATDGMIINVDAETIAHAPNGMQGRMTSRKTKSRTNSHSAMQGSRVAPLRHLIMLAVDS
jgi:hypothetical protein